MKLMLVIRYTLPFLCILCNEGQKFLKIEINHIKVIHTDEKLRVVYLAYILMQKGIFHSPGTLLKNTLFSLTTE